ncbi:MAG: hypothetical protein DRP35_02690 [Candidatus Zixiibacteriota bacterium]|nr:MAG: hypothetical protein DRP35_02690 [candidate division Zixibacteria bacterium]
MKVVSPEELKKLGLNRYEAIIIASQHARYLNSERIAKLERLEEDPSLEFDARKITMVALKDLMENKIKFKK